MSNYITGLYVLSLICCTFGLYHSYFNANFLQRIALALFAIWAVWRIVLVQEFGWSYPHEPLIATAIALFAVGTFLKTRHWRTKND